MPVLPHGPKKFRIHASTITEHIRVNNTINIKLSRLTLTSQIALYEIFELTD